MSELKARVEEALEAVRAPDVVLAVSRDGDRTVVCGGTTAAPPVPREETHYELGSLSKTFTVLLLADLARAGVLGLDDPLARHLPAGAVPPGHARRITLRHLATHTAGLPRLPRELIAGAVLHPYANAYAGYDGERLLRAFARTRVRRAPGSRWHYSNFGMALLGLAVERAAGAGYAELLSARVLDPLSLASTGVGTATPGTASVGHRSDGRTPLPPGEMGVFGPVGGLCSTPGDLLGYAEALIAPDTTPSAAALRDVQVPHLRRGLGRRHTHTLTWFLHPYPAGPVLFHAGATFGHQAFLGFHPATATAVAAVSTRHDRTTALIRTAQNLLHTLVTDPDL